MKRLRDEVLITPQIKRPFGSSSRGESNGTLQAPSVNGGGGRANGGTGINGSGPGVAASSTQKLTTNDALSYLKQVKDMFQHQREKYDAFLDVMKDFKGQRIDTAGVIERVKELFDGHPNLILGFNTFLPKGYEITLVDEEEAPPKKTVEFEEAISFVNKIKKRFQNDDHVYKSFLDILNMYRKEHKVITKVYQEVAELFGDHPDLLDEFTRFLPDTSATTASAPHTSFACQSFHCYDEKSSVLTTMRSSHMDKERQQRDMTIDPKVERDLSVERPEMEDDKTVMKLHKEQKRHTERENRDRKNHNQDDRDHNTENNGDISMHRLSGKKKFAQKVEDFGGTNLAIFDVKDALKSNYNYEFSFCEKVKERLCSADDYQAFLKCLHIYSTEIITRKELQSLVADLLGKYPDIMENFNEFLERCERIDGFLAGVMGKKSLCSEGNSSKSLIIDEKENEPKCDLEGGKEKDRYNTKYWGKSIQELDLSNCERCTPSYRLLPVDYPIASASRRSELDAQVLNDNWVSVTSGSEDYSFNHMRRNQFEESLFRCEDDRFELDMLLESVRSTAKQAEELLNNITNNSLGSNGLIRIEEYFTALSLRCIERLYGDHGLDVVDILRKNPSMALPVILTRLKQKQEDWTKCRSDFNKVWADIYSKNHYKSLDHRSFYFKQQDSKNLSTKSLVAEIKEIKEKMQKEDYVILSTAAGSRCSVIPNIEFEYEDAEVHEDIFRIIKYSCEEVCSTKEQFNKVMRLWTTFLEPVLGVHCRPFGLVTNEDGSSSKHPTVKNNAIVIESEGSPNNDATTTNLKQPKSNCNGDSIATPQRMNFSKNGLATMDSLAKEELAMCERVPDQDTDLTSEPVVNHGRGSSSLRVSNGTVEGGNEAKPNVEDIPPSEGGEKSILNQLTYRVYAEGSITSGYNEDEGPVDPCKNEKEEGELSPINDVEDNFGAYHNSSLQALPEKGPGNEEVQDQMGNHEEGAVGESDVDADNEDSENISEAREDVSGSDSAAEECSREEPEEEEDAEHDDLYGKAKSEGEADNASDFHYHCRDAVPQSERFLPTCTPLSKHVISSLVSDEKKDRRIFYGNDTFYVLFRLHQTLYERILSAKVSSVCSESKWRTTKDARPDPYARFMSTLFSLLDGSSDNAKFEDDCRSLIGNHSYMLFTLDKLIYKLVKQLQTISGNELDCKLLQLYEYEKFRKPEKFFDSVYYENVDVLLHGENIYRLECTSEPSCLSIQLMDDGNVKSEAVAVSVDPKFATYLYKDYLSNIHGKKELSAVMLKRNMQKCSNQDESTALYKAMENVLIMNGLECKMVASSSKISYVLDTEDFFIRLGRRRDNRSTQRSSKNYPRSVQQFHRFLAASITN